MSVDAKAILRTLIKRVPILGKPYVQREELRSVVDRLWEPPGHFYSPIPNLADVERRRHVVFSRPSELAGIDLRPDDQLALLERIAPFYSEQPFGESPGAGLRYGFENPAFGYCDALVWHCMLRHLKPRRVIEVGSGYSSCVLLDTNATFFDWGISCTFIEPYPDLLYSLMHAGDRQRVDVVVSNLQNVPLDRFLELEAGDVLFIDSSHVTKTDSDVNYAFFEILPRLAPGVVVHVHDILYPFEYPAEWVFQGRAWNEAYLLRAFLLFNARFEITLWNSWLEHARRSELGAVMPLALRVPRQSMIGSSAQSIWLRRT